MARPVHRIYATSAALLSLGLAWAGIAGQGSGKDPSTDDPRIAALAAREAAIEKGATRAAAIVDARWAAYRAELKRRKLATARAQVTPVVRYVTLPPVTVSRSS